MSGSFLDTTVVVELAEDGAAASWARAFLSQNQPAQVPYYALRELLTGRVRILCDTHNKLHAAENIGEAMVAISSLPSVAGRTKQGAFQTLALALSKVFDANPHGDRDDLKREMLQDIASSTTRLWNKARRASGMSTVQALACFSVGKLSRGIAGELRGPSDSFNCSGSVRCAAAAYMHDNQSALSKLIEALHPDRLDDVAVEKRENQQRRKALKHLKSVGPNEFHKGQCRALGDAYFASMCPAGMTVVTTNASDHLPLCVALGKPVASPD